MRIVDLSPEHESLYFTCLEPWSEEMEERGAHKERWYQTYRDRGLVVKLAIDDDDEVVGMIQSLPVEETWVDGENIDFILCIWVHGHRGGVGNRQGRGLGTALLSSLEHDAAKRGRAGVAAWGLAIPTWMRASWYKTHGYAKVDADGMAVLLFKPFDSAAKPPRWGRERDRPSPTNDGATVTAFSNGWCPAASIGIERARCACACFPGDPVEFVEVETNRADSLFVGDREIPLGPPPTQQKVEKAIARELYGPWWFRWLQR